MALRRAEPPILYGREYPDTDVYVDRDNRVYRDGGPNTRTREDAVGADLLRVGLVPGGEFVFDQPEKIPAAWGTGDDVLWSEGEAFLLAGPTGVGKTTLGVQLVAGRLGLLDSVLGFPVTPGAGKVLYLAMDRPAQIARAMARLLTLYPRKDLDERLVVYRRPLYFDVAKDPEMLLRMAERTGADTVVVDSLKDATPGDLKENQIGQGISRAMNFCVAEGVQTLIMHHVRKEGREQSKNRPPGIDDVFGSAFITASAGSVVMLEGRPGDGAVKLHHLKQPAADVGPLFIRHDHARGRSFLDEEGNVTVLDVLRPGEEVTVAEVAMRMNTTNATVTPAARQKARRALDKLVANDKTPVRRIGDGQGNTSLYVLDPVGGS
ncbi:AAA family ATPase [Pseudonocardia halophobica]|uniref:AAA family ATPase n=1 Tax=Pseudonocardia halophobica TaxID=29401 RepID=UPI003D8B5D4E